MPIQCPKCKVVNRDTANFCQSCGNKLVEDTEKVKITGKEPLLEPTPAQPAFDLKPGTDAVGEAQFPIPRIGKAPSIAAWFFFLVFIVIFSFITFAIIMSLELMRVGTLEDFIMVAIFCFLFWLPFFIKKFTSKGFVGIVTHLRSPAPNFKLPSKKNQPPPNWIFNLQRTNEKWQPLKDSKGFLLPIVEVVYRSDQLHGSPLEEGCRVAVRGKKKRQVIKVKAVWNLSASQAIFDRGKQEIWWGRITNWTHPKQEPDLLYPDQNRFIEVWNFRLQQTDQSFSQFKRDSQGNLVESIPVEIRARTISGPLQDGDRVEIQGQRVSGTLYAKVVYNHSAGGASIRIKEQVGAR
ncbi:MAG: hypothetical protein JSV88_25990 [Candidatus Aminicenantes bacterium]|nr:MAG: hypothetical protein JSV88_25990 [Candidatus Aminicenantes bacterium]